MEDILSTGWVSDIDAFIAACHFPADAFVLTETLPRYVIKNVQERLNLLHFTTLKEHSKERIDMNRSTSGRVFQADFELRWEKEGNGYRVIYLGTQREVPGLTPDTTPLKGLKKRDKSKQYYLFGEILDADKLSQMGLEGTTGYYAEVRIPRLLYYPAPPHARRVQLIVCEYIEETTGRVQLFRFQSLAGEEER